MKSTAILTILLLLTCQLSLANPVLQPASGRFPIAVFPERNDLDVALTTDTVWATFSAPVVGASLSTTSFRLHGSLSGFYDGTVGPYDSTLQADFDIDNAVDLLPGEVLTAILTDQVEYTEGGILTNGYQWQFTTAVSPTSPGEFLAGGSSPTGEYPYMLTTADFNLDGYPDIATAAYYSSVVVHLNDGFGGLADTTSYSVTTGARSIHAADLNSDGYPDLAVAHFTGGCVSILLNDGDGSFTATGCVASGTFASICSADLDGDGDLDLAAVHSVLGTVQILVNDGAGNFTPAASYAAGTQPIAVIAADLDSDGDIDLATSNLNSVGEHLTVLLNDGSGSLSAPAIYDVGGACPHLAAADLDGDGDIDLATAANLGTGNPVGIIVLNDGVGSFSVGDTFALGGSPRSVVAADFDGDTYLDLAIAHSETNEVGVAHNNGAGVFSAPTSYGVGEDPFFAVAADLDGDSDMDLVSCDYQGNGVSVLFNAVPCCEPRGDVDNSGDGPDIADLVYLVSYMFQEGPAPECPDKTDVNGDLIGPDIADLVYLVTYMFQNGPEPVACP